MTQGPHLNIDSTVLLCQFSSICMISMIALRMPLTQQLQNNFYGLKQLLATSSSESKNMLVHRTT